jgi:hypothetical protein
LSTGFIGIQNPTLACGENVDAAQSNIVVSLLCALYKNISLGNKSESPNGGSAS